ncbi:hypothetical protein TWF696_008453 [Orbilia brochopaga]|uniref:Uncharacterized protein n=1 Tax=Orbilia brochopaga TaxID=3140254 RepID=A0AAV9UFV1_9PEZI
MASNNNPTLAPEAGPEDRLQPWTPHTGGADPQGGFAPGADFAQPAPFNNIPGASSSAAAGAGSSSAAAGAGSSSAAVGAGFSSVAAGAGSSSAAAGAGSSSAAAGAASSSAVLVAASSSRPPPRTPEARPWRERLRRKRTPKGFFAGMTVPERRRRRRR